MAFKSIIGATCTCLAAVSINASATIISVDWQMPGDNLITRDTNSGLEWLDLTATTNRSADDVSSKFGIGQEFDGWRYAEWIEITGFFDTLLGRKGAYAGWHEENAGLMDAVAPYWGDTQCAFTGCTPGEGSSLFAWAEDSFEGRFVGVIRADKLIYGGIDCDGLCGYADPFTTVLPHDYSSHNPGSTNSYTGHALVRFTVVPLPGAVWLFGSGLVGLIGVARRKKA